MTVLELVFFLLPHTHSESAPYLSRWISVCVSPRLSSCRADSWATWGNVFSSFSQVSSSRLGTTSQTLYKEPVLLFPDMLTTPPWMYMQPAWVRGAGEGTTWQKVNKCERLLFFFSGKKYNNYKAWKTCVQNDWPEWRQHSESTLVLAWPQAAWSTVKFAGWPSKGQTGSLLHYSRHIWRPL